MKNFKRILSVIIIDYVYCVYSLLFSLVVNEYIHDIFTDFERFKFMHSFIDHVYAFIGLLVWIFFTIFIIKYNTKFIVNKKLLNLKVIAVLIFFMVIGFIFYFLTNSTFKNFSVTEEISARFKSIDKNSIIQNRNY